MDIRDVMDIDIDAMGIPDPKGHPNAARGAERERTIPYIRSETEKSKKPEICPKSRGPQWDLNPRGYAQEIGPGHQRTVSTSHQTTLVIGGINVINTGMGCGQYAHSKGVSAQRGE
jgi:hypothetical protein